MLLEPPYSSLKDLPAQLQQHGYVVIAPDQFYALTGHQEDDWTQLAKTWQHLPPDEYLRDGGRYRQRRHASFVINNSSVQLAPHRAHWQPVAYNALHGGIDRWFEPCEEEFVHSVALKDCLINLGNQLNQIKPATDDTWYVEVHQFRIDTTDGIGRPTPEGAHRDGVDFVAVLMLGRHQIKGGETRVFEANGPQGQRFTLNQSFSLMVLDDERVIHESTPIQPIDPDNAAHAWRDTLVVTFRRDGFQDGPKAN